MNLKASSKPQPNPKSEYRNPKQTPNEKNSKFETTGRAGSKNFYGEKFSACANFLPLPPTKEWGEDRGEGRIKKPTRLLSPTLSSIGWRRGRCFGCGSIVLGISWFPTAFSEMVDSQTI
jgi:hypothetical protein